MIRNNNNKKGNNNHNKDNHNKDNNNHNNKPTTFKIFKKSLIQNERIAATKYMRGGSLLKWA